MATTETKYSLLQEDITKGLSEEVAFKLRCKCQGEGSPERGVERTFWTHGTACAEILREEVAEPF